MNRANQLLKIQKKKSIRQITILAIALFIIILVLQSSLIQVRADDDDEDEDDDDDDEDLSSSLGWASVGLFAVSSIYIAFYQTYRITRRLSKEGKQGETRQTITNIFLKVRKPLLYVHYFAGLAALIVLLTHGIMLTDDDSGAIIGWATAGVYIFYIFTGILLWFKIISYKRNPKLRKAVLYIHRSLLIFAIIIAIHIIHLALVD